MGNSTLRVGRDMVRYRRYQQRYRADLRAEQNAGKPMSFAEIGRRLGVTGEYARQLYTSGMRKLLQESKRCRAIEPSAV